MKTPATWTDDIAPAYFGLKAQGMSDDDAAQAVRVQFHDVLAKVTLATISRQMRAWRGAFNASLDHPASSGEVIHFPGSPGESPAGPPVQVPPPLASAVSSPLSLKYEDGHVWCDCHIPYHIPGLMELSLERARAQGVRTLYMPGDIWDLHWATRYLTEGKAAPGDVQREFEISRRIMDAVLQVFDRVVICPGNHDGDRFKWLVGGVMGFQQLLQLILGCTLTELEERFTVTPLRWFVLKGSPWGDWRLTHPKSARAVPLSLAETIAHKENQNVLTAHQHYLGARFDRYGRHIICDGGHMQDEALTEYKVEVDTSYSHWAPGYVELVDGWPHLVTAARFGRRYPRRAADAVGQRQWGD